MIKFDSTFKHRITALVVAASILGSLGLTAGCSKSLEVSDASSGQTEIVLYNWGEYIAEDTIAKFEAAYPQYKVVSRYFETNETMYPNLTNSYDVIVPSDYMVCRLIRENKLQKLDYSLLPNVTKNMDPLFKNVTYDQDKTVSDSVLSYAAPYLYCTVGLVYDANKVTLDTSTSDPKTIWGVLFDTKYKNQIGMYDSMRESVGVALNSLGYSLNTLDTNQLSQAQQMLLDQKKAMSPTYGIDNLKDKMASGELVASEAWSGDYEVIQSRIKDLGNSDKINLQFALPKGSNWSVDMMCIPSNAKNVAGAHALINFMYDPEIALANCEYVGYSTPNTAAKEMLPDDVKNNTSYYPDSDTFKSLEIFYSSSSIEEAYTNLWNTVKASS
jgi:spermidine/putrescine-binding protein